MSVMAIFTYNVKPGRFGDFMAKLQQAAEPKFNSKVMPKTIRLFRDTVPAPKPALSSSPSSTKTWPPTAHAPTTKIPTRNGANSSPQNQIRPKL